MLNNCLKMRYILTSQKGDIYVNYGMQKNENEEWSPALKKLMKEFLPSKSEGRKYFSIRKIVLLKNEERESSFDEVKDKVDSNINLAIEYIKEFEEALSKL